MRIPTRFKRGTECDTNRHYQNTMTKTDTHGNPCRALSPEERIALAAGMSFAGLILILVATLWIGKYVRKRRKAARVKNESQARVQDEKRDSQTTPFLLPRARMPWGAKRASAQEELSEEEKSSSASSSGSSPPLTSEESFFSAPPAYFLPRLSADGVLLPPRPAPPSKLAPERPAQRPPPLRLDVYTALPVLSRKKRERDDFRLSNEFDEVPEVQVEAAAVESSEGRNRPLPSLPVEIPTMDSLPRNIKHLSPPTTPLSPQSPSSPVSPLPVTPTTGWAATLFHGLQSRVDGDYFGLGKYAPVKKDEEYAPALAEKEIGVLAEMGVVGTAK